MTVGGSVTLTSGLAGAGKSGAGGPIVFAVQSDPGTGGGDGGNYAATELKPSGSWSAGGNGGAFTYNYPIISPAGPSAVAPAVSLSYSSASADGQTSATQAQANWAGDGWATPRSYIEQTFTACSNEPGGSPSPKSTSDMCQAGPILTLSLMGSSTALVWDSGLQVWRPANDDGSVITHVTNTNNGSGTYNSDYWTVTTRAGAVYYFGRNQLPGWSAGKATTDSVDYQPVYGAHPGDPCYNAAGFDQSWCIAAYRWNLDYTVDTHGNAMSLYYKRDKNFYGQNNGAVMAEYVRDSHLDHVDYGFTDGQAYGTVPNRIEFVTGDRCVAGTCQPLNEANKANWPDVPFDLICASGATCTSRGPAYFSTVRLASIITKQWSTAASAYQTVDTYTLTHTIPATGDATAPTLWLSKIDHTRLGRGRRKCDLPAVAVRQHPPAQPDQRGELPSALLPAPALHRDHRDRFRHRRHLRHDRSVPGAGQPGPCDQHEVLLPGAVDPAVDGPDRGLVQQVRRHQGHAVRPGRQRAGDHQLHLHRWYRLAL